MGASPADSRRHPGSSWAGGPTSSPIRKGKCASLDAEVTADFYLTQIVSHHQSRQLAAFLETGRRGGLDVPGVFGVFYYRSANIKTLEMLSQFLPVPVEELKAEFAAGATPIDVCARTIRALVDLGAKNFYVSNLPIRKASVTLNAILDKANLVSRIN